MLVVLQPIHVFFPNKMWDHLPSGKAKFLDGRQTRFRTMSARVLYSQGCMQINDKMNKNAKKTICGRQMINDITNSKCASSEQFIIYRFLDDYDTMRHGECSGMFIKAIWASQNSLTAVAHQLLLLFCWR